ncbi:BnaC02g12250D [Brassica napus]|uniref:(rape) hypothetical protein n=1 Tax=Brassica napus TaxID=3708 RepID=A0A078HWQ0_BRANA|nr:unnamed protein product [Brassica napus]CDY41814.1 BnaC02g12250D [Brassica napus]
MFFYKFRPGLVVTGCEPGVLLLSRNQPSFVPRCLSFHLHIIKWKDYRGSEEERELTRYIFSNSECLKKATFTLKPISKRERGDVYSYGVLIMELATGRRAVDGGNVRVAVYSLRDKARCTADQPHARPNMKEVLSMLVKISGKAELFNGLSSPPQVYIEM